MAVEFLKIVQHGPRFVVQPLKGHDFSGVEGLTPENILTGLQEHFKKQAQPDSIYLVECPSGERVQISYDEPPILSA
jgi:hypothetical protein